MIIELIIFTVVLSIDSFSAALALGFRHFSRRRAFLFACSSGFGEGAAAAIGFLLGSLAQNFIAQYDHWVAFSLLSAVGAHMCYAAYREIRSPAEETADEPKKHSILKIIFVSSVTSIDALGVGVSLGLVDKPIFLYSTLIGVGAFFATYLGLFLAKRISSRFGGKIEFAGGVVLILLGIKMLTI
ncbi:MAG: manganese efflux pump [Acidobacteria bacterium]|nr:manganese efflux pump [Acidobacteriota bacterium]